jgi:putative SOS response-associated peptidase YedK
MFPNMCGRYTLTNPEEAIAALFPGLGTGEAFVPRYNVAPTQTVCVVREGPAGREAVGLRWGLVPGWAKPDQRLPTLINARSETVHEKPSFRAAYRHRRCVVLADGFYEWERSPEGKLPWRFTLAGGQPFAMAGIWERWTRGETPVESVAILTTRANALVGRIHDRMPVVVEANALQDWLGMDTPADVLGGLLKSLEAEKMTAYRVSPRVNKVGEESPELVKSVE